MGAKHASGVIAQYEGCHKLQAVSVLESPLQPAYLNCFVSTFYIYFSFRTACRCSCRLAGEPVSADEANSHAACSHRARFPQLSMLRARFKPLGLNHPRVPYTESQNVHLSSYLYTYIHKCVYPYLYLYLYAYIYLYLYSSMHRVIPMYIYIYIYAIPHCPVQPSRLSCSRPGASRNRITAWLSMNFGGPSAQALPNADNLA